MFLPSTPTTLVVILGVTPFLSLAREAGLCYRPDGTQMDDGYVPCQDGASMCCHSVLDSNGGDQCGSGPTYGLCGVTGTQLWRESCTDPTWKDPACLQLCVGGGDNNSGDDAKITKCFDGSYCCGYNNSDCCAEGSGVWIVNNQVQAENPNGRGADDGQQDSSGMSTAAIVGIGLGSMAGVILLWIVAVFLWNKNKRIDNNNTMLSPSQLQPPSQLILSIRASAYSSPPGLTESPQSYYHQPPQYHHHHNNNNNNNHRYHPC